MKIIYPSIISIFVFCLVANGQTTIYNTVPIGYITPVRQATDQSAVTVPIDIVGENVTWDCSNLEPHPIYPVINRTFMSPLGTLYYSDYPNSNYYWTDPDLLLYIGHHYLSVHTDSLVWWGQHVDGDDYEIYDNPEILIKFPFSYGDTYVNTYSKQNYYPNGNPGSYSYGTNTLYYEGYGTLILPTGTITNVAKVRNVRTKSFDTTTVSYDWIIISTGEGVLHYRTNGGISVTYISELPTSIHDLPHKGEVSIYPNPLHEYATLELPGESVPENCSLRIMDISGRIVSAIPVMQGKSIIHRNGLATGIYIYQLIGDHSIISQGKLYVD